MWVRPSGLGDKRFSGVLSRGPIGMVVDLFVPAGLRRFSMLVKGDPEKVYIDDVGSTRRIRRFATALFEFSSGTVRTIDSG